MAKGKKSKKGKKAKKAKKELVTAKKKSAKNLRRSPPRSRRRRREEIRQEVGEEIRQENRPRSRPRKSAKKASAKKSPRKERSPAARKPAAPKRAQACAPKPRRPRSLAPAPARRAGLRPAPRPSPAPSWGSLLERGRRQLTRPESEVRSKAAAPAAAAFLCGAERRRRCILRFGSLLRRLEEARDFAVPSRISNARKPQKLLSEYNTRRQHFAETAITPKKSAHACLFCFTQPVASFRLRG